MKINSFDNLAFLGAGGEEDGKIILEENSHPALSIGLRLLSHLVTFEYVYLGLFAERLQLI